MGVLPPYWSDIVCGRRLPPAGAIVCVGRQKLPSVLLAGAERYPARCQQEQSVNRLQRALPASQYFPNPPNSSQFYRAGSQVFALRRYTVCRYKNLPPFQG